MRIEAVILIEPTPKGRPRTAVKDGRVFIYTPKKTAHAEHMIREALINKGNFGDGIPLKLKVTFYRLRPKTLPKRFELPVKKPDLSNYLKTLEDALEQYVYHNDSQITCIEARKRFGFPPRIELRLEEDEL